MSTELPDNDAAIPADSATDMTAIPTAAEANNLFVTSQLISILSIVTAQAAQTNWICEQIQGFYASMPGFMRKGITPNG